MTDEATEGSALGAGLSVLLGAAIRERGSGTDMPSGGRSVLASPGEGSPDRNAYLGQSGSLSSAERMPSCPLFLHYYKQSNNVSNNVSVSSRGVHFILQH